MQPMYKVSINKYQTFSAENIDPMETANFLFFGEEDGEGLWNVKHWLAV